MKEDRLNPKKKKVRKKKKKKMKITLLTMK